LRQKGTIARFKELADSLNWSRTSLSNVVKERRNIPLHIYNQFIEKYNLKATIPKKVETDYREDIIALLKEQIALLKEKNERLEKELTKSRAEIKKLINEGKRSRS